MQGPDGTLCLTHMVSDLSVRETRYVVQDHHFALLVRENLKSRPNCLLPIQVRTAACLRIEDCLRWCDAIRAQVVDRDVVG